MNIVHPAVADGVDAPQSQEFPIIERAGILEARWRLQAHALDEQLIAYFWNFLEPRGQRDPHDAGLGNLDASDEGALNVQVYARSGRRAAVSLHGSGEVARDVHALIGNVAQKVVRRRRMAMERGHGEGDDESHEHEESREEALRFSPNAAAHGEQDREGQHERGGEGGGRVSPLEVEGNPVRQQTRYVADRQ